MIFFHLISWILYSVLDLILLALFVNLILLELFVKEGFIEFHSYKFFNPGIQILCNK